MPVARVSNLTETLKELKKRGMWIYGLDMEGENWCSVDLTGAAALVVGSEGERDLAFGERAMRFSVVLAHEDTSPLLNASVACGIALYEAARQRLAIPAK